MDPALQLSEVREKYLNSVKPMVALLNDSLNAGMDLALANYKLTNGKVPAGEPLQEKPKPVRLWRWDINPNGDPYMYESLSTYSGPEIPPDPQKPPVVTQLGEVIPFSNWRHVGPLDTAPVGQEITTPEGTWRKTRVKSGPFFYTFYERIP